MKRFLNIMMLVLLGAMLLDWLWPFGFRFKYWQGRSDSEAPEIVAEYLQQRFPVGTPSGDVKAFLEGAGATCRDRFEYYRCEYWHLSWYDVFRRRQPPGTRMFWAVDIWYDVYDRQQRLAVRRWRERL